MKDTWEKVIHLSQIRDGTARILGKRNVLCFGHFNVIHPGHLRYFQRAKSYGTTLVVAMESDRLFQEFERRTMFSEEERAQALAALEIVDQVVILDDGSLESLITTIKPNILVLGTEFKDEQDIRVKQAVQMITDMGGSVFFEAGDAHYATSELLRSSRTQIEHERWDQFRAALNGQNIDLAKLIRKFTSETQSRLLVIGDTIVDRYVACDPVGMSTEAPVIVVKELDSRDFVGGAAIVSAHIAALGAGCEYLSVIGIDPPAEIIRDKLDEYGVSTHLFEDRTRPTTFKIRYLVENQKLFRVSRLREDSISRELEDQIVDRLRTLASQINGIVVSDFVYGTVTPRIIQTLQDISREYKLPLFGDLQCSSQVGDISKFKNFSVIFPTEREARIALSNQEDGIERVANILIEKTGSKNLIMKMGAEGLIAYERGNSHQSARRQHFPALTVNPLDAAGAGDSLLAAVSILIANGYDLMEASAIGTCVASLAVETVGNLPIRLSQVNSLIDQYDLRST